MCSTYYFAKKKFRKKKEKKERKKGISVFTCIEKFSALFDLTMVSTI